jgi:pimeloyl-ACP methyl ester carboxylesterase
MGRTVVTTEGRRLEVECTGDERGHPVFLLHGTPGSRDGSGLRTQDLYRSGIHLITYDRPGYGGSDRLEGRRVVHAAADVAAIAQNLGLCRFSVVGRSGGSPHALACAALLPHAVRSVAVMASLAPPDTAELSWPDAVWFKGMAQSNITAFQLAREDPAALRADLLHRGAVINSDPEQIIVDLHGELSDGDRWIVMDPGVRSRLVANFTTAFAAFGLGWYDDVISFVNPWGFDVAQIKVPTLVWHGADDEFSPVDHYHWLADHIPGAKATIESNRAHFGAVQALPRVLNWLVNAARGNDADGFADGVADEERPGARG